MPASPALILLAAGGSNRMGEPKQLLQFEGKSLLRRAADTALASRCRPVIVVLGANAEPSRNELADLPVEIIENADWPAGMGTSIRAGMRAIAARTPPAVLIMLCDQPRLTSAHLDELTATYERGPGTIIASAYSQTAGVPALFDARWFHALAHLDDSAGARQLIQRYADAVTQVPCPAGAVDIDTPGDYQRLTGDPPIFL